MPYPGPSSASTETVVNPTSPAGWGDASREVPIICGRLHRLLVSPLSITIPPSDGPEPVYLGTVAEYTTASRISNRIIEVASDWALSPSFDADGESSGWPSPSTDAGREDEVGWSSREWIAYFAQGDLSDDLPDDLSEDYSSEDSSPLAEDPPVRLTSIDIAMRAGIRALVLALLAMVVMYTIMLAFSCSPKNLADEQELV